MTTDRTGPHKVLLPISQLKLWQNFRKKLDISYVYISIKKTTTTMATMNSAKCETKACTHGVFRPLTQAWHVNWPSNCPITSMMHYNVEQIVRCTVKVWREEIMFAFESPEWHGSWIPSISQHLLWQSHHLGSWSLL